MTESKRVLQMRLVVEAVDYDEALRFYRDVLGADVELQIHGEAGEKVTILDVGRATLEGLQLTLFQELAVHEP
jgi:catechol 2,3-dioxygenase-like lactoylglutathione lyase family enzyme